MPTKQNVGPGGFALTLVFILAAMALSTLQNISQVKKNWAKVRCQLDKMLFASFYGFNSSENFEFCMKKGFDSRASSFVKPFYTFLASFVSVLTILLSSINSIRMVFATLVGSVTTLFSNFNDRIKQLFFKVQMTFVRMKFLIGRISGTMYAIIYMALSGISAVNNFGQTFLFSFLNTFCFDPDTKVELEQKGVVSIRDVVVGDRFALTGKRVTGTFQFYADGQDMVALPAAACGSQTIYVSSNHYIQNNGTWIQAKFHPNAEDVGPWCGGTKRLLICLNTEDHCIPIDSYLFRDYDETDEADEPTMKWVLETLNGRTEDAPTVPYVMCVAPSTRIRMKDGSVKEAAAIQIADALSTGRVHGIVKREVEEICSLGDGSIVTPGCALWDESTQSWKRAGTLFSSSRLPQPTSFYSFVVVSSASFELESGTMIRDYVEVHSPEAKDTYGTFLESEGDATSGP
jgi:hypothetical protein